MITNQDIFIDTNEDKQTHQKVRQTVAVFIHENGLEGDTIEVYNVDTREEETREVISETLWAFYPPLLAELVELPVEVIETMQDSMGEEDLNNVLHALIDEEAFDTFYEHVVQLDGYGFFLSNYNNEEHKVEVDGETYYFYEN